MNIPNCAEIKYEAEGTWIACDVCGGCQFIRIGCGVEEHQEDVEAIASQHRDCEFPAVCDEPPPAWWPNRGKP